MGGIFEFFVLSVVNIYRNILSLKRFKLVCTTPIESVKVSTPDGGSPTIIKWITHLYVVHQLLMYCFIHTMGLHQ